MPLDLLKQTIIELYPNKELDWDPKNVKNTLNSIFELQGDDFDLTVSSIVKEFGEDVVLIKHGFKSLQEKYPEDFAFNQFSYPKFIRTIGNKNIYEYKNNFYVTRGLLLPYNTGNRFYTLSSAIKSAEDKTKNLAVAEDNYIEMKFKGYGNKLEMATNLKKNDMFTSLNLPLPNRMYQFNEMERSFLYTHSTEYNLAAFKEFLSENYEGGSEVAEEVDNNEKAAYVLYAYKAGYKSNKIIENLRNAKPSYFIVESASASYNPKGDIAYVHHTMSDNKRSVLPVKKLLIKKVPDNGELMKINDVYHRPQSMIQLLNDVAAILRSSGAQIEILSNSEMEELMEERGIKENAFVNGFILDGTIYINGSTANTTDMLHEYTHLLLGILKSKDMDAYYNLVEQVNSTVYGKKKKRDMKLSYPYLSDMDLNEEVFAELFSKFLNDNFSFNKEYKGQDGQNMFDPSNDEFRSIKDTSSIFNNFNKYKAAISVSKYKKGDPQLNPNINYAFSENLQAFAATHGMDLAALGLPNPPSVKINVRDMSGTNQAGIRTDRYGNISENAYGIITKKFQQNEKGSFVSSAGQFQDTDEDFELFKKMNTSVFDQIQATGKNTVFQSEIATRRTALPMRFAQWLGNELNDRFGIEAEIVENKSNGYDGYGLKLRIEAKHKEGFDAIVDQFKSIIFDETATNEVFKNTLEAAMYSFMRNSTNGTYLKDVKDVDWMNTSAKYRRVSNWLESKIKEYQDTNKDSGILEKCE